MNKSITLNKMYIVILVLVFIAGICIRAKSYFSGYTFWLDECSLALNIMHRNIFGYFSPLEHVQSAPPFFMMATKVITHFFGINEFSLRFIPFVSSIASLPLFYLFSKKFLTKKYSIVIAFLLFALNCQLFYFGAEFKQYSSDVMMCLLAFLFFSSFKLDEASLKKILLYGALSFGAFLFSLPVIFIVGAFVLYSIFDYKSINKQKIIKLLVFLTPFIIFLPIYYLFVLFPSKYDMVNVFLNIWQDGFITLNLSGILKLIRINLIFFFEQRNYTLFGLLLLIMGFVSAYKSMKLSKDFLLLIFIFVCVLLASYLQIYPIKERVALYLFPFLLVMLVKPLDAIMFKCKIRSIVIIALFLFFTSSFFSFAYYKGFEPEIIEKKGMGTVYMKILKANYKDNEIVVYNDASDSIYEYNSMRFGFSTNKFIRIGLPEYSREFYMSLLNQLPKGRTYWFYYPYDYHIHTVTGFVKDWAKDKTILRMKSGPHSLLLHVKN